MDPVVEKNIQAIKDSPLGKELEDSECNTLGEVVALKCLQSGDVLVEEGVADDSLHVIVKGRFAVTRSAGGGDDLTLHIHEAGDFAGEMGFVDGLKHTATLKALGESEVYTLERGDFEKLVDSHPWIVFKIMRLVVRSVHNNMARMNNQYLQLNNYITHSHGRY